MKKTILVISMLIASTINSLAFTANDYYQIVAGLSLASNVCGVNMQTAAANAVSVAMQDKGLSSTAILNGARRAVPKLVRSFEKASPAGRQEFCRQIIAASRNFN